MADIQDLYEDVTTGGHDSFTLDYHGTEFEFQVKSLTRVRKNEVLASLPEGFLSPSGLPDDIDPEELSEMDDAELVEAIESNGGDVGELMSEQMLDREATEVVIDAMVDAYNHPDLSDTELENLLRSSKFPDKSFNQMLNKMIDVSTPDEGMRDFRRET
jgi:hypothetical protein